MNNKHLVIRLSSLGDVILATSALEVTSSVQKMDWVVSKEYSELLINHPKINQLYLFDRKSGLSGWVRLCRLLWENEYQIVYDLHGTLRTRVMKFLFLFWSIQKGVKFPAWKRVSKEKPRLYLYYLLKRFCPKMFRPRPWTVRSTQLLNGTGQEKPNLKHLLKDQVLPQELLEIRKEGKPGYLCVMPSSRWDGKKWPVSHYVEALRQVPWMPVILGASSDVESRELVDRLRQINRECISGIGQWSLSQTAFILKNSVGYLGGDTGLAHLAEAVGARATVIFGPTVPDMGFGPWRTESQSIGIPLSCRPCGKDGRFCYRLTQKYQCLKGLNSQAVLETLIKN
jgi:ADP-heptose:LPS heptosyltransferase